MTGWPPSPSLFETALHTAAGQARCGGPLAGVPLLLKDHRCSIAGMPYFEGTRFLRTLNWRAAEDSYLATRIEASGFVIVGRTTCPELVSGPLVGPTTWGPPRNPWDLSRTP